MQEQIGKVKIKFLDSKTESVYSDGDSEDELLSLFKNGLTKEARLKILNDNPSWAIRYHLAYERGNLLNWYPFKEGASILEVGSGCGSITEVLVQSKAKKVVANELSQRRATVNAYRNKGAENLEIIVGNLQDYTPTQKFDYVVCVGVLEYAGTFIDSDSPYQEFLKILSSFLKPGGRLLLAIENKLGFKYFAGAREDHTLNLFDGINQYPEELKVKTFGRKELLSLMQSQNFKLNRFYYPHPDYKLPLIVFSDDFYPGGGTYMPLRLIPSTVYDSPRYNLFSEQSFIMNLEENGLYKDFANSFLVEATKE
jgi:2-polyprenyl-3-methyl-5-hydroxy-6-metoxy-1,4-benzoquinol methylase